jgi:decaprenylphospho-beta-D-erythro-pentofuranosid-2-ulose 2-reductase
MNNTLVIGATSAIAEASARLWAARGDRLHLVGRNPERLTAIASDLLQRGASDCTTTALDLNQIDQHPALIEDVVEKFGYIDTVLIAHGTLSDQTACQQSVELTLGEIHTNALSAISLLTLLAEVIERQHHGSIAVISSVAGDRGRESNYVYGSAKAMITTFSSGLRQRLQKSGGHVLTIKPGFVDTPMTASFRKGILWAKPEGVAKAIVAAIDRRRSVIYVPWFWWGIMAIIRSIPELVFKRIKL